MEMWQTTVSAILRSRLPCEKSERLLMKPELLQPAATITAALIAAKPPILIRGFPTTGPVKPRSRPVI